MEENIKILMTTDTIGGVWTYTLELLKSLEDYPIDFYVLGLGAYPYPSQIAELKAFKNVSFYPSELRLEWMENPQSEEIEAELIRLAEKIQPDLIHFNNYVKIGKLWNFQRLTVFHSCVHTWWKSVKKTSVPEEWNAYFELVENALNASNRLIFPTEAIYHAAKNTYRIHQNAEVIPNAREINSPENISKENFMLCVGRIWDEAKNIRLLSELSAELNWPIYVAGEQKISENSKDKEFENLRFFGRLTSAEIEYYMKKAAIYINPAFYEPFGLSVLEAAQSGCALALSKLDSLQEIWQDTAVYFDPSDAEDLKSKLHELIQNKEDRILYQKKSKERARYFNRKKIGENYFRVYRELIQQKTKSVQVKPSGIVNL